MAGGSAARRLGNSAFRKCECAAPRDERA